MRYGLRAGIPALPSRSPGRISCKSSPDHVGIGEQTKQLAACSLLPQYRRPPATKRVLGGTLRAPYLVLFLCKIRLEVSPNTFNNLAIQDLSVWLVRLTFRE